MENSQKLNKPKDLIKATFSDYKQHVLKFIELIAYSLIGILPFIVILFVGMAAVLGKNNFDSNSVTINYPALGIMTVFLIASLVLAIIYSIKAQVGSIILLKKNFSVSAKESFKQAKPYIWPFLGLSLLLGVLVIAWGLLFIIPAFIFGVYYGFAQYVMVAEDKRPFSSVERSYDLIKNYWWPVFGRFCLLMLLGVLADLIVWLPTKFMVDGGLAFNIYSVFANLVWIFISPFFMIYSYKVYENLKKIKS